MQALLAELSGVSPVVMDSDLDACIPLLDSLLKLAHINSVRRTFVKRNCAGTLVPFVDLAMFLVSGGAGRSDLIVSGVLPLKECLHACLQDPRGRSAV
jgi:hypothetical protein